MEEKKFKVVFRRGSIGLKIMVTAMVLLSMAALLTTWFFIQKTERTNQQLREEAALLEQENHRLAQKIEKLGTVAGVFQIAKEELGLVDPDAIIVETE